MLGLGVVGNVVPTASTSNGYSNLISSTSKIRTEFGGMIPGWPFEPYA